jgi:hypothetical protein
VINNGTRKSAANNSIIEHLKVSRSNILIIKERSIIKTIQVMSNKHKI